VIRVEAVWLAVQPLDMRMGAETALSRVVNVFGAARPHHAYVFANRRADRLKVLMYDGVGMWLCTRRLQAGSFAWPREPGGSITLTRQQFEWLVHGLPWQRIDAPSAAAITVV
jgi:transposase